MCRMPWSNRSTTLAIETKAEASPANPVIEAVRKHSCYASNRGAYYYGTLIFHRALRA